MRGLFLAVAMVLAMASPAAAARSEPWTIAFITYRSVDATCQGRPIKNVLTDSEYATTLQVQQDAVALINSWNPRIKLTPTYISRPVLTGDLGPNNGPLCWADPPNVPSAGSFDTQYTMVDPYNDFDGQYWYAGGGLSYTLGTYPYGGGYCTSQATDLHGTTWERNVIINEWLHPTTAWFRERGAYVADGEWPDRYGYSDIFAFYQAIISGANIGDLNGDGHPDSITRWHQRVAGTPL